MKLTTSKKLLWWAVGYVTVFSIAAFVAWLYCGDVSPELATLTTTIAVAIPCGYFAHSSADKNSLNKHCGKKEN